jgi:hypothetical protein
LQCPNKDQFNFKQFSLNSVFPEAFCFFTVRSESHAKVSNPAMDVDWVMAAFKLQALKAEMVT